MNIQIIDQRRTEKRISVKELCEAVGIDRSTYYNLLKNPESMKLATWRKIADYLELSTADRKASLT